MTLYRITAATRCNVTLWGSYVILGMQRYMWQRAGVNEKGGGMEDGKR